MRDAKENRETKEWRGTSRAFLSQDFTRIFFLAGFFRITRDRLNERETTRSLLINLQTNSFFYQKDMYSVPLKRTVTTPCLVFRKTILVSLEKKMSHFS